MIKQLKLILFSIIIVGIITMLTLVVVKQCTYESKEHEVIEDVQYTKQPDGIRKGPISPQNSYSKNNISNNNKEIKKLNIIKCPVCSGKNVYVRSTKSSIDKECRACGQKWSDEKIETTKIIYILIRGSGDAFFNCPDCNYAMKCLESDDYYSWQTAICPVCGLYVERIHMNERYAYNEKAGGSGYYDEKHNFIPYYLYDYYPYDPSGSDSNRFYHYDINGVQFIYTGNPGAL